MKKALRVILPVILIILILLSVVWYLMEYDPSFTRDTIMYTARTFDEGGHHKIAAWLYDVAYFQSKGSDEVAIELAQHYKSHGNYTKAEYTLSGAIADGGTLELYVALCQTYVEQDKLLDAINMLNNITNEDIKAQIEAMRPLPPTFTPEPAFYSQYINVEAISEGNTIYMNLNGQYPSTDTDLYSGPVAIPNGETTIYAVSVNEQNLVSNLTIQGYTIGGVIEKVSFKDPQLEAHVRSLLSISDARTINSNDLWPIKSLTMPGGVTTYEDLPMFTYLEELIIDECSGIDLTPISSLTKLTTLTIGKGNLSMDSLKAIGATKSLTNLTLTSCGISSASPFEGLTKLKYLNLTGNTLRNIEIFNNFTALEELHMRENALIDLSSLSTMKNLTVLDVSQNALQTIDPVFALTELKSLYASNNAITDVSGISALTKLQTLDLSQNGLKDLSALSTCKELTDLNISYNVITDISFLVGLPSVVRLDASNNKILKLPAFTSDHQLGSLLISYNDLENINALSVLPNIYLVDIDHNPRVRTLNPLKHADKLTKVNCFGTKVSEIPFSESSGIVVNMDLSLLIH